MKNSILFIFAILFSIIAKSQDVATTPQEISIYKQLESKALVSDKKFMIKKSIVITNADADFFWPVYEEYNAELEKLNNEYITFYSDYIEKKDDITFSIAMDLMEKMMSIDQNLLKLEKKYYKKMSNGMNPVKVVSYINIEREVQLRIRLELIKQMAE